MPPFRLAHLSDPHLVPPEGETAFGGEWLSKRTLSRLSWRKKRSAVHRPEVLEAVVADIQAHAPDHIAVTGDLTNFSTKAEWVAARAWLMKLGPPSTVTLSLGNHDVLVREAAGEERMMGWSPWLHDFGPGFPAVRDRQAVVLINLCSAVPTRPFSAEGELGAAQLERLAEILAREHARFRIVLLHHAVVEGTVKPRKALRDRAALREVLRAHGAELVLHGHAHAPVFATIPGPRGAIPVMAAPSASARPGGKTPAAGWRLLEIAPSGEVAVVERGFDGAGMVETGRYRLLAGQPA
ncbi:MAG TPA: metallophosphoesterase [Phenylobacterium sp.]|nr:metallophosphoesterase [Phenylobacterium sp.]